MSIQTHHADKPTPTGAEVTGLSTDDLHHLLSNQRRRTILRVLHERGATPKGELAEWVASRETGTPREQLDHRERKRVYISLYQCHLPKLRDHDAVTADGDTYTLGAVADELLPYLDGVRDGWVSKALGRVVPTW